MRQSFGRGRGTRSPRTRRGRAAPESRPRRNPLGRAAAAWVLAVLPLLASPSLAADFALGAQLAGNRSSLTGDLPDGGSWSGQFGYGAGLLAEVNFTRDISLAFQPSYTRRTARQTFEDKGEELFSIDRDFNYVALPLLVRVAADPPGVRGFVTAGLDVGILVDASATVGPETVDISGQLESHSLGALFGAGALIPVGRHLVTLEARYVQGLKDIVDRTDSTAESEFAAPSVKYRALDLLVGFLFDLGGG